MNGRPAAVSSIVVVRPPCTSAMSHAASRRCRSGRNGCTSTPGGAAQRRRVDPRAGDDDHPQPGHLARRHGIGLDRAAQQVRTDARATDRDEAHRLVRLEPELGTQRVAIGDLGGVESRHIAGEVVVLAGPRRDVRQTGTERRGHDVVRIAHEDAAVAQPRRAGDLLDHLGVVVGGEVGLAAVRHRQPADEIGEPRVGRCLQLRVLVQEVVEFPCLVADPEVVALLLDKFLEHHEVRDQDLVHLANRLECMQIVLAGDRVDVRRLVEPATPTRDAQSSRVAPASRPAAAAPASQPAHRAAVSSVRRRSPCPVGRARARSGTTGTAACAVRATAR